MPDSNTLVRLPVAVFALAFRKSMQTPRASDALHAAPSCRAMYTTALCNLMHTCHQFAPTFHLLSRVGEGDISAHRYELTGSCSSNLPMLSLEVHLGVTTSPHTPFPAGYVTLSMCNRSPPLRLSSAHRSGWTIGCNSSFIILLHSKHAQTQAASSRRPPRLGAP